MTKQFEFVKPKEIFYEDVIEETGFKDIFGVKFFRPNEFRTIYEDGDEQRGIPLEVKSGKKVNKYIENITYRVKETPTVRKANQVTDEQWDIVSDVINSYMKPFEHRDLIIGRLECPFTGKKLKDIRMGTFERKTTRVYYYDEDGDSIFNNWGYHVLDPYKNNYGNTLQEWYAPEVIDQMYKEWFFDEKDNISLGMEDATVVADMTTDVVVFYNKGGYASIEPKKVYVSSNGRFFKNRGSKNEYIDSPDFSVE